MKDQPPEILPPNINTMADTTLTYSSAPNDYPASNYYPHSLGSGVSHVHVASQPRSEPQQRKRPKYTRSKTGCLTCRVKKIKCDESKPICMRCTHGQRDCTWPEGVPTRKKAAPRKEGVDGRPSTAESSGLSETSTPPTRDSTPPRRSQADYSLPPVVTRRHSEPFVPPLQGPEHDLPRRQLAPHPYLHGSQSSTLSVIPEHQMPAYQSRYDHAYGGATSMHPTPRLLGPSHSSSHLQMRSMTQSHHTQHTHQQQQHQHSWTQHHQMLPPLNPMEPFFHTPQERNLVGHSSNDHHPRYQ